MVKRLFFLIGVSLVTSSQLSVAEVSSEVEQVCLMLVMGLTMVDTALLLLSLDAW